MPTTNPIAVYFSFLVAMMLHLFPWEGSSVTLRPDFMLVVLIYWLLRAPQLSNIGTAWLLGLMVDLATGSLFGQYALSFTLTAFVGLLYQRRLALFNTWQLLGYVFGLFMLQRILVLLLKLFAGQQNLGWEYLLPLLTDTLLWLLLVAIFGNITRPKTK